MNTCPEHKDTLLLDVYGELDPQERVIWEQHLAVCESCQQDKKELLDLIQATQEAMPATVLSPEDAHTLYSSIVRKLRTENRNPWWERLFKGPGRLVPSLATACLLILLVGWFSLKDFRSSDTVANIPDRVIEEQSMTNNVDLLENLELLQEMESLEKLVNLLDHQNQGPSLLERESKINHVRARV